MNHPTLHNTHPEQTATLFVAASETDSNLYYATRFIAPDPFIYLEVKGERLLIMSDLEVDRARQQATVDRVLSYSELERRAKAQGVTDPGTIDVIHLLLHDAGLTEILVPSTFPFLHATRLQELGYRLRTKREPFYERRVVKSDEEVRHIEAAQRATETAVAAAHQSLRRAEIRDNVLWLDGEILTSERIKKLINVALMECDCVAQHTIVAGGEQACDPHNEGSGPLPAHRSIIFDVFPHRRTRATLPTCRAPWFVGKLSAELTRLYHAVKDAQEEAITKVRDGADGAVIHQGSVIALKRPGTRPAW